MGERLDRLLFNIFIYGSAEAYTEAQQVVQSMPILEMHIGDKKGEVKTTYVREGFAKTEDELTDFTARMCLELPAKPTMGCAARR